MAASNKTSLAAAQLPGGSETLLVVDDDDTVRTLLREMLRTEGYTVLEARFNSGALMAAGGHKGHIHLMVADLMMPGVNGRELGRRLHTLRPDMRILYISGYPKDVVFGQGLLEADTPFLEKPISADTLLGKIRTMLDADAPESEDLSQDQHDDFVMEILTTLLDEKEIKLSEQQISQLKTLISDYEQNRLVHEADFMVAELHAQTSFRTTSRRFQTSKRRFVILKRHRPSSLGRGESAEGSRSSFDPKTTRENDGRLSSWQTERAGSSSICPFHLYSIVLILI